MLSKQTPAKVHENLQQCANSVNSILDELNDDNPSINMIAFLIGDINARLHLMIEMTMEDPL